MPIWNVTLSILLVAFAGIFCAFVLRIERRLGALEAAARQENARVQSVLQTLEEAISSLNDQVNEARERAGVLVAPAPPRSGLNLGKRSQALRLHGHGETVEKIAGHLDLPRADVKLLLKIHDAVMKRSQD